MLICIIQFCLRLIREKTKEKIWSVSLFFLILHRETLEIF